MEMDFLYLSSNQERVFVLEIVKKKKKSSRRKKKKQQQQEEEQTFCEQAQQQHGTATATASDGPFISLAEFDSGRDTLYKSYEAIWCQRDVLIPGAERDDHGDLQQTSEMCMLLCCCCCCCFLFLVLLFVFFVWVVVEKKKKEQYLEKKNCCFLSSFAHTFSLNFFFSSPTPLCILHPSFPFFFSVVWNILTNFEPKVFRRRSDKPLRQIPLRGGTDAIKTVGRIPISINGVSKFKTPYVFEVVETTSGKTVRNIDTDEDDEILFFLFYFLKLIFFFFCMSIFQIFLLPQLPSSAHLLFKEFHGPKNVDEILGF